MIVDEYGLSPIQEGMLFHHLSGEQPGVDIEQIVIEYASPVDVRCLERAWQLVMQRHPGLRTSIQWRESTTPCQQVHDALPLTVAVRKVSDTRKALAEFLPEDRLRGVDLSSPPLMRLTYFDGDAGPSTLVWTVHHILLDGRAFVIILSEVEEFCQKLVSGEEVSVAPGPDFRPYIDWLRKADTSGGPSFWAKYLEEFTAPTPLPVDVRPGQSRHARYGEMERRLSLQLTSGLRDLAAACKVTLNTVVMAAWGILLGRYSGEQNVLFGATKTTRRGSVANADSVVGLFLNTVPVKMELDPALPLSEVLQRLRSDWIGLRAYEHTPLTAIKAATAIPSSASLFDSLVVFETERFDKALSNTQSVWQSRKCRLLEQTNFELTFAVYGDPEMLMKLEYDATRFSDERAQALLEHVEQIFSSMVADPAGRVYDLRDTPPAELHRLLHEFNPAAHSYPAETPLQELLEAQVAKTPGAVAVTFGDRSLTYAELNALANQLAGELLKHGAGPDQLVGLCAERSLDIMVALLAICKSGAAYLPIDPYLPAERMAYMIEDSGLRLLVTDRETRPSLPSFDGTVIELEDRRWRENSRQNLGVNVGPEDLAYVLYTSGSTGKPKAVEVPRRALTNLLCSVRDWFGFTERDCLLAVTTISFDIAGADIWLPWLVGARTILASREAAADGWQLRSLIEHHEVTFLQATPVTWRLLLDAGWPGGEIQIVCTGEAMPQDLATSLAARVRRLWNMYGPTETTIWSTGYPVEDGAGPVLIGRPVANTRCYILDAHRQPVPIGAIGELYIAGDGLARGYRNRPELTAEKFVNDPFHPGERMYRTGDLARYQNDGNIECLGRTDHQVKIRGFRIELGEIETALQEQHGVAQAVVMAREDTPGDKRLAAYLVCHSAPPDASELRRALKERLPEYMVPAAFVTLDKFPLTPSGKIDRKMLPAPAIDLPHADKEDQLPTTPTEQQVAQIFSSVLGLNTVGVNADFFEIGGHSLKAAQAISQINAALGTSLPIRVLFRAQTVRQLAAVVDSSSHEAKPDDSEWPVLIPIQTQGSRLPLFCVARPNVNALGFLFLSRELGSDQPCYGLQAHLEEDPVLDFTQEQYETTATKYIAAMRVVQPEGPYQLIGQCQGAFIAFEMARQLEAEGQQVTFLSILDTWVVENTRRRSVFYANAIRHRLAQVRKIGLRAALRRLLGRRSPTPTSTASNSAETGRAGAPTRATPSLFPLAKKYWPGRDFKPTTFLGKVTVFKVPEQMSEYINDDRLGWSQRALGGVDVEIITGQHDTYSQPPHVKLLADKISLRLHSGREIFHGPAA